MRASAGGTGEEETEGIVDGEDDDDDDDKVWLMLSLMLMLLILLLLCRSKMRVRGDDVKTDDALPPPRRRGVVGAEDIVLKMLLLGEASGTLDGIEATKPAVSSSSRAASWRSWWSFVREGT